MGTSTSLKNNSSSSNSIFKNSFFTIAGQKERLANTGKVLGIATGLYNPDNAKIVATTKSPLLNKALEVTSNHPFITAGVVAGGITAVRNAPAIASAVTSTTGASVGGGSLRGLALAGAVGLGAGALLSGGGSAKTGPQTTNPTQTPTQTVTPSQDTYYNTYTDNSIRQRYNIMNSPGSTIGPTTQQNPAYQNPSQYTPSYQTAEQETNPSQTASTTGTNWLLIAGIVAGAYLLTNRR